MQGSALINPFLSFLPFTLTLKEGWSTFRAHCACYSKELWAIAGPKKGGGGSISEVPITPKTGWLRTQKIRKKDQKHPLYLEILNRCVWWWPWIGIINTSPTRYWHSHFFLKISSIWLIVVLIIAWHCNFIVRVFFVDFELPLSICWWIKVM